MASIIIKDFIIWLFILLRMSGIIFTTPIFISSAFPNMGKVLLSSALSYMIFLTLPEKDSIAYDYNLLSLALIGLKEMIIGIAIGFTMNIIFYALNLGGMLIGFEIGLTMANVINPMEDVSQNVIGEFIYFAGILVFLLINGHHFAIKAGAASFEFIKIGKLNISESFHLYFIKLISTMFIIAVKLAIPFIVSFFLLYISEAIIARVIPQMQIFFVLHPLKIGIGLLMLILFMTFYVQILINLMGKIETDLYQLLNVMRS